MVARLPEAVTAVRAAYGTAARLGSKASKAQLRTKQGGMAPCEAGRFWPVVESNSHEVDYFVCCCCRRNSVFVVEKH